MSPARKLVVSALGALVALALAAGYVFSAGRSGAEGELWGVRLGDSSSMARDRFRAPAPGAWTSTAGKDATLTWLAVSSASPVASARFEFHDGMLVATRMELAPGAEAARGAPLELSRSAIVAREPAGDRTRVTLISRSCPEHADEVKQLLARP